MSLQSAVDTGNKSGFFAISIDGTDSPVIERKHSSTSDKGSVGVCYRSGLLAAGTYTIKGRHYTEAGVTLTSSKVSIVSLPAQDDGGNVLGSIYDTVATDDTASLTLEDIDALTQDLTMASQGHAFAVISASVAASNNNRDYTLGINIDSEDTSAPRNISTANDKGSASIVGRSASEKSGTITIKGQHAISDNTGTAAPSILVGMDFTTVDSSIVPSARAKVSSLRTTTATTLEDISGASVNITLKEISHIVAVFSISAQSDTNAKSGFFAININGTDFDEIERYFSGSGNSGSMFVVARTVSKLAAGSYDVKARWRTEAGVTLSSDEDISIVAFALETSGGTTTSTTTTTTTTTSTSTTTTVSTSSSTTTSTSTSSSTSTTTTSTSTTTTTTTTSSTTTTTTSTSTTTSTTTTISSSTTTTTTTTTSTSSSTTTTVSSSTSSSTTTTPFAGLINAKRTKDYISARGSRKRP